MTVVEPFHFPVRGGTGGEDNLKGAQLSNSGFPWLILTSVPSFPGEITPRKVLKTNLLYIHGEAGRDLAHCMD